MSLSKLDLALQGVRAAVEAREGDYSPSQSTALLLSIRALLDCREHPCWLKGTGGRMLYLNPAYAIEFSVELVEYSGEIDNKVWDSDTGASFATNDQLAIDKGSEIIVIEQVPFGDELIEYRIRKWPVYLDGQLIGVAGESLGRVNADK